MRLAHGRDGVGLVVLNAVRSAAAQRVSIFISGTSSTVPGVPRKGLLSANGRKRPVPEVVQQQLS